MRKYPSDLTDIQWQIIKNYCDNKRKRKYSIRKIFDALLYMIKSGVQWRMLPLEFPKWQLVYYYFRKWIAEGLIEEIHDGLRERIRFKLKRNICPSLGLLDSQSVKTHSVTNEKGYDGNKKIQGRKRHIITDTLGFILAIVIHSADINDRSGATLVLEEMKHKYPRLKKILADQGYTGELVDTVVKMYGWTIEIVKKVVGVTGFNVLPKRWIVERTFGWLGFQRRLVRDYEVLPENSVAFTHMAMIRIMLNRIKN